MSREYTQEEADRHNALTEKGWAILDDYILLLERDRVPVGFFARRRLKKAASFFQEALQIAPDNFSTKWALGKVHQVLGECGRALEWFEKALELEKENADVWREASLAAMACKEFSKALEYGDKAVRIAPGDAGLHCNRALALMFLKRDAEAVEAAAIGLRLAPDDPVAANVRKIVHSVVGGGRSRPGSMEEI